MNDAFELEICQGKYRYRYEAGKQEVWRNGEPWEVMNGRLIGDKFVFSLAIELDEAIKERDELLEACKTFAEWLGREESGFARAGNKRDTPEGERAWRDWYNENIRLCALAQEQVRAAIARATGEQPKPDCGEAGHDEGCCGNRQCLPGAQPAPSLASGDVSLISEGKTQPAQSVPDDILRDAVRYRFLRAAKNIPISSKAARDPVVYDAAIDAAMLAAAPEAKP